MRPLRLIIFISTCVLTVLLLSFLAARRVAEAPSQTQNRIHPLFDWRAPSSLFPPSAVISLTDDNSTFFLARPANFGPSLPQRGLSGQLWIGSGFGEDGSLAYTEGELGCSDVPGWSEGDHRIAKDKNWNAEGNTDAGDFTEAAKDSLSSAKLRRRGAVRAQEHKRTSDSAIVDGTDDHLNQASSFYHNTNTRSAPATDKGHADIQSIQESAEIAGKVVLLTRGGCGFLEKVKWVQRRGGTALIVGDNVRGGALVTMYARGDTSNVTIPSLFTSHTTAHLLSSLVPSGLFSGNLPFEIPQEQPKPGHFTSETTGQAPDSKGEIGRSNKQAGQKKSSKANTSSVAGWLRSVWSGPKSHITQRKQRSSRLKGIIPAQHDRDSRSAAKESQRSQGESEGSGQQDLEDDFVIGVQDWRDPDLLKAAQTQQKATSTTGVKATSGQSTPSPSPTGGSITPGSGDYGKHAAKQGRIHAEADGKGRQANPAGKKGMREIETVNAGPRGNAGKNTAGDAAISSILVPGTNPNDAASAAVIAEKSKPVVHRGLWVTLQPTTVSASPFFDTLLVLVISPLVTLTVVYALLLLRSRIRRQRWRAPKSVVERLPVRTYHTIASSNATTSSIEVSRASTPPSPNLTTPLLQGSARPISHRHRSRTVGDVTPASSSYMPANASELAAPSLDQIQEKREAGLAEWRRRYGGKQKECVVCLDEYVDGVSQVMSLPCGHEFHAECITPWLTTRRRTCPICKGDVVRSLTRSKAAAAAAAAAGSSTARPEIDADASLTNDDYDNDDTATLEEGLESARSSVHGPDMDQDDVEHRDAQDRDR